MDKYLKTAIENNYIKIFSGHSKMLSKDEFEMLLKCDRFIIFTVLVDNFKKIDQPIGTLCKYVEMMREVIVENIKKDYTKFRYLTYIYGRVVDVVKDDLSLLAEIIKSNGDDVYTIISIYAMSLLQYFETNGELSGKKFKNNVVKYDISDYYVILDHLNKLYSTK